MIVLHTFLQGRLSQDCTALTTASAGPVGLGFPLKPACFAQFLRMQNARTPMAIDGEHPGSTGGQGQELSQRITMPRIQVGALVATAAPTARTSSITGASTISRSASEKSAGVTT